MRFLWSVALTSVVLTACDTTSPEADGSVADTGASVPTDVPRAATDTGPRIVGACDDLAAPGVWENITPLAARTEVSGCFYGGAFAVDPLDTRNIYLGSCEAGFWRSADCGASWTKIDTGTHHEDIDAGRQWTMVIDPIDPQIVYTNSGYNTRDGNNSTLYKSVNGGIDFTQIWPPAGEVGVPGFVGAVEMDPTDHLHLLLSFHASCSAPHNDACLGESTDGGETWSVIEGDPSWTGGEGAAIFFLGDADTWLWQSQSNGMWRTTDHGATWILIGDGAGHGAGALYRTPSGAYLHGSTDGVLRSTDSVTWTSIPNSGNLIAGLTADGSTIYSSRGFPWNPPGSEPYAPFRVSTDDGLTWTELASPMLSNGGQLHYDVDHHILYSANLDAGFWRVVL